MKLSELMVEPEVNLELAPLIDVLFLIVLFYAVSSSMITPQDLAALRRSLDSAESENRVLAAQVSAETQRAGFLVTEVARVRADLGRRDEELSVHTARVSRLEGDLRAASGQMAEQAVRMAEQRSRLDHLQGDLDATRQREQGAVAERDQQGQRLQALQKDLTAREQALAEHAQRIVLMDQDLARISAQLASSREAETTTRQKAEAAAGEITRLEGEGRRLSDTLSQERSQHAADVAAANADLEQLRLKVAALSAENARHQKVEAADQARLAGVVEAQQRLSENLRTLIEDKALGVQRVNDRLVLELSDKILFDSGSDQLKQEGLAVLGNVARVLSDRVRNLQVQVGGHTDNVPLGPTNRFGSNWALSAARAVNVVRFFQGDGGVDPSRLAAVGYGEYQPVAPNTSPEGRSRNRRIEIVLVAR